MVVATTEPRVRKVTYALPWNTTSTLAAATNREYFYDYANQDPVNNYDLSGTCICLWGRITGGLSDAWHFVGRHKVYFIAGGIAVTLIVAPELTPEEISAAVARASVAVRTAAASRLAAGAIAAWRFTGLQSRASDFLAGFDLAGHGLEGMSPWWAKLATQIAAGLKNAFRW